MHFAPGPGAAAGQFGSVGVTPPPGCGGGGSDGCDPERPAHPTTSDITKTTANEKVGFTHAKVA